MNTRTCSLRRWTSIKDLSTKVCRHNSTAWCKVKIWLLPQILQLRCNPNPSNNNLYARPASKTLKIHLNLKADQMQTNKMMMLPMRLVLPKKKASVFKLEAISARVWPGPISLRAREIPSIQIRVFKATSTKCKIVREVRIDRAFKTTRMKR